MCRQADLRALSSHPMYERTFFDGDNGATKPEKQRPILKWGRRKQLNGEEQFRRIEGKHLHHLLGFIGQHNRQRRRFSKLHFARPNQFNAKRLLGRRQATARQRATNMTSIMTTLPPNHCDTVKDSESLMV